MYDEIYKDALLNLVAYCQRNDVLSTGEAVTEELSDIFGWDEEDVDNWLFD